MEYSFEIVNCNLCNSNDYKQISKKGLYNFPTNVVLCKKCGLSYLNPRWDRNSYLKFYQCEYDKYYRPKIADTTPLSSKQINPISIRLERFGLLPKKAARILDIGSGTGANLMHFKSLYQESKLYAIEPSFEAQTHLKKSGVTVIASDVDSSWDVNQKEKYDIIIMRHVLEHFLDPMKIMKKVRAVLANSGIVYIAVPNNLNPTLNLEKRWFRNVHTYYFNKYSLDNLSNLVNLEIIELVEGDDFNAGEIYLVVKKSKLKNTSNFSILHYQEQLSVLEKKMKEDKSITMTALKILKRISRKIKKKYFR